MKTKLYLLIICFSILLAPAAFAQKKSNKVVKIDMSAQVIDQEGKALVGVFVSANEGVDETVTDDQGYFVMSLKDGSTISFEYPGYQTLVTKDAAIRKNEGIVVLEKDKLKGVYTDVTLPYQTKAQYKSSASVVTIDTEETLGYDYRTNVSSALVGRVTGLTSLTNMRGYGSGAITVVDGIIRDVDYITLQEVESVTVLKDAVSRAMYGAEGDMGVIMIKTKRGESNKKILKFDAEYGVQSAISYPKYLNAADYMTTYNQAAINDGGSAKYSTTLIENTANGVDPILYPDNDYYSSDWVKSATTFSNVYGEASGGNESVRYFMNMGWKHNDGWISAAEKDQEDILNLRGKVDFEVTKWLKMHTDASVVFDITSAPNMNYDGDSDDDFWTKISTFLPNTTALLIPTDRVSNLESLSGVTIIQDDYILGGTSVYQDNILGNLESLGSTSTMNRFMQFKVGFDMDLNGITKGLTASGSGSFEFNNSFIEVLENTYAVYEITNVDDDGMFEVSQHGVDTKVTAETVDYEQMYFSRTLSGYVSLNYDRTFGKHSVNALAMGYGSQIRYIDEYQESRRLSVGVQASYMYDDKYLLEAAWLNQASLKMAPDNRWGSSPSFGAAWILSNEEFMSNQSTIDYFKLRASYGVIQNDNWTVGNYDGYYLYDTIYDESNMYYYNNTANKNYSQLISSVGTTYGWQKRKEFTLGFDAYLFNKSTWVEASVFNSTTYDMMTLLSNQSPSTAGGVDLYGNYNSTAYRGVEIGARYSHNFGGLRATIGANYLYTCSEILEYDEAEYTTEETMHLSRIGHSNSAMWALEADGLYSAADFNADGSLVEGLATSSYGTVQEGDIKYVDFNNDGVINANDIHDTGCLSGNNHVGNVTLELNYNNWTFFALGSFGFGGKGYKNSDYYWFAGDEAKYSEFALKAYDPSNPDPNAECPRLTLTSGNNNYRNSTYWMYSRNQVNLDALQVGYNFATAGQFFNSLKVYVRASNLLKIGPDADILQLNVASTPQSRLFSLGVVASF